MSFGDAWPRTATYRLLVGVYKHVRLEMPGRDRGVVAQITFETLLALVRLQVHLEVVPVGEALVAPFAGQQFVAGVQLLHVDAQVGLAAARRRTQLALHMDRTGVSVEVSTGQQRTYLEDRLVAAVDQSVRLQRVALGEPGVTHVALVRLLT